MACDDFSPVVINTSVADLGHTLPTFFLFLKKKSPKHKYCMHMLQSFIDVVKFSISDPKKTNSVVCTPCSGAPHTADWFMYRKGLFEIGKRISVHEALFSLKKVCARAISIKQATPACAIYSKQSWCPTCCTKQFIFRCDPSPADLWYVND